MRQQPTTVRLEGCRETQNNVGGENFWEGMVSQVCISAFNTSKYERRIDREGKEEDI
jgi:hypothetical protein